MIKPTLQSPKQNRLLAALSAAEFGRLSPHLELVSMSIGETLFEPGDCLKHIYFPATSIVSLIFELRNGSSTEIAVVGSEGVLGISLFMGGETSTNRAVVQSSGFGYRLKAQFLKQEFNFNSPMLRLLLLFTQALITQMTQTAVCNRHHSLEQQLCRCLLMRLDRTPANSGPMKLTQEMIAQTLGVRREGVTEAAGHLQKAGLIRYSRGHIEVIDRTGLEQAACECYAVVKKEYDRLVPDLSLEDNSIIIGRSDPYASRTMVREKDDGNINSGYRPMINRGQLSSE